MVSPNEPPRRKDVSELPRRQSPARHPDRPEHAAGKSGLVHRLIDESAHNVSGSLDLYTAARPGEVDEMMGKTDETSRMRHCFVGATQHTAGRILTVRSFDVPIDGFENVIARSGSNTGNAKPLSAETNEDDGQGKDAPANDGYQYPKHETHVVSRVVG